MNVARGALSAIAVFVFIFIYEWLFHGQFLMADYTATAALWRGQAEMMANMGWLSLGQALFAVLFAVIFTKGYEGRGVAEGIRYGFLIGLLLTGPTLVRYAVEPIPATLAIKWILGGLIEAIGSGIVAALVYRPAKSA